MENTRLSQFDHIAAIAKRAALLERTSSPTTLSMIELHNLRQQILIKRGIDPQAERVLANGRVVREIDLVALMPDQIADEEFRLKKIPISIVQDGVAYDVNSLIRN